MDPVGWVEHSETHQKPVGYGSATMGFAALNPSYSRGGRR